MKKNLLKPYFRSLIKSHSGYILFDFIIITLAIVFCLLNTPRIVKYQKTVYALYFEINSLKDRLNTLNASNFTNSDLKKYLLFLNKLIPNSEDYFSIIYALEEISKKTNFIINSYDVNLKQSTASKLKLTISGIGDKTAFMNFLKSYSFVGGRLITSDKIELNSQVEKEIKIDVTFYNKKTDAKNTDQFQTALSSLQEVSNLYNKVNISLKDQNINQETEYPRKRNPF